MRRYRLTPSADAQLQEIWAYSNAHWGRARADRYLDELEASLTRALANPQLLRPRFELGEGVHAMRSASHMIYGVIVDDELLVIGVLHARLDPKRWL